MGTLVRSIGWEYLNSPAIQKSTALLNDGTTRISMVIDSNQSGVSGDGGDGTGVPKAYIYSSGNGITWTLRATINMTMSGRPIASFTIDSANNIHVAWKDSTGAIQYVMLTYSAGPAYAVGSTIQVAAAPAAGEVFTRIDIDAFGTSSRVIVGTIVDRTATTKAFRFQAYIKTLSATFSSIVNETLYTGDSKAVYSEEFGLACDQQTVGGDNITTFAAILPRRTFGGADLGDYIRVYEVNTSTPSLVSSVSSGIINKGNGKYRSYKIYSVGADTWVVAGIISYSLWKLWIHKFSYNRTTNAFTTIVPYTTSPSMKDPGMDRTMNPVNNTSSAYTTDRVTYFGHDDNYSYAVIAKINGSTVSWFPYREWDGTYKPSSVPPFQIWAGTPRNYSTNIVPVQISYTSVGSAKAYRLEWREKKAPGTPVVIAPGAGSNTIDDLPTLTTKLVMQESRPQTRVKVEYQLATDSGFASNLRTVTEDDADFTRPMFTAAPDLKTVYSSEVLPELSELFTSTWYIRARLVDELGYAGSYSTANSFTVSHPPTGANLYPIGGALFIYATGNIPFKWVFTDPSSTDFQTAYRIVVEEYDTQAQVIDTGKIISAANEVTVAIPVGAKDKILGWRLTLWDSDDAQGPQSSPNLFLVTDGPVPVINSPTPGQVLTTAIPAINWTPGIASTKTQNAYRVVITQGSHTVLNTGWVSSSATTYTVPLNYLTNSQSYTVTVYIRDNFDLEGQTSVAFSTAWTPPATRSLGSVNLSEFATKGFVWVAFDPSSADADFIAFNVYRRQYGESSWTVIGTITKQTDIVAFQDYLAGSGVTYEYAMTQVVDRFGDIIESSLTASTKLTVTPRSDGYWLLDTTDGLDSVPLFNVTGEEFTTEYEEETYNVIGRGRHVDYGDRLGFAGSMSAQLRDKFLTGSPKINYATNPSLSVASTGSSPDGWTVASAGTVGTLSEDLIQVRDPHPTGRAQVYRLSASNLGSTTGDMISLSQVIQLDASILTGDVCTFSCWLNDVDGVITDRRVEIAIRWETAANALVTDSVSVPATSQGTYTSPSVGSPDYGNSAAVTGHWKRFAVSAARPATATQARVRIQVEGTGLGSAAARQMVIAGAQFEKGSLSNYFDGSFIGSNWIGPEDTGISETSGYYTARRQRLDIEEMKYRRRAIYLRSPFGDIWLVAAGNIGTARVPGTGTTEFTNVTIPYREVAF